MSGPTVHSCTVALLTFFKKITVFTSLNHIVQLGQFCGHLCNYTAYIIRYIFASYIFAYTLLYFAIKLRAKS